jgi:hypothetical protein
VSAALAEVGARGERDGVVMGSNIYLTCVLNASFAFLWPDAFLFGGLPTNSPVLGQVSRHLELIVEFAMRKPFYILNDLLHGFPYGPVMGDNDSVILQPQIGINVGKELPGSERVQCIAGASKCSQSGFVKQIPSFLRCCLFQPTIYIGYSSHDSFRRRRMRFGPKSVWIGYLAQHPKHYENRNDPIETSAILLPRQAQSHFRVSHGLFAVDRSDLQDEVSKFPERPKHRHETHALD